MATNILINVHLFLPIDFVRKISNQTKSNLNLLQINKYNVHYHRKQSALQRNHKISLKRWRRSEKQFNPNAFCARS